MRITGHTTNIESKTAMGSAFEVDEYMNIKPRKLLKSFYNKVSLKLGGSGRNHLGAGLSLYRPA
jgi:hypothetical protein